MTEAKLRVEAREERGKGPARRMRQEGRIPGSLYGHGIDPVSVAVDERELEALLAGISVENTLIDLTVGRGRPRRVLIRDVQRHPVRPRILHVDFFQINVDEKLVVNVPLHLTGSATGVKNGGVLQQIRHEIEVECLPTDIPELFEVDISALDIGDSLHVRDIDAGGLDVRDDGDLTICAVAAPRIVEEEEAEEEGLELIGEDVEPEVLSARPDEDEDTD
ncbi:MAG: 50S ribosomal protein L25/general stress protein Ctc [Gemmatimonadota bacterium]|nr:50S ribosomal protein L25/general stress protein Ctc [Gemmatimonadota bacterium]